VRRRVLALLALAPACAACALAWAPPAHAEQKLQQSPLILDLDAAAGDVLHETLTVSAPEDALVVEIGHADLGFDTTDYHPVLIQDDAKDTTSFSTRGWFTTPKPRYRIPAGGSVDVPVTISVPANTPGGTHMGAILVRTVPDEHGGSGAVLQAVLQGATLVFVAVEGGDPPRPRIEDFDVPSRVAHGPLRPTLVVANAGDEYFRVGGTVRITGRGVDDEVELTGDRRVVPGQARELRAAGTDEGDEDRDIELGDRGLAPGRYTVTARLKVEPTGTTLVATRHVWVIPAWLWLAGAVAVAALLALAAWLLRRWMRAPLVDGDVDDDDVDEPSADEDSLEPDEDPWDDEDSLS
jgi:hypothetical protein